MESLREAETTSHHQLIVIVAVVVIAIVIVIVIVMAMSTEVRTDPHQAAETVVRHLMEI